MPSEYTTRHGFEKQGTGENINAWGERLNNALDLVDESISGRAEISLTGNYTLDNTLNESNEMRRAVLIFTDGGLTSAPTVTIRDVERQYFVENRGATYAITFTAGGTTGSVPAGATCWVTCDSYNVKVFDPVSVVIDRNGLIRFDVAQNLTSAQKKLARFNIGLPLTTSVQDHGGDDTGTADASIALGLALDEIIARGGGTLKITGRPRLASRVSKLEIGDVEINIVGDGATNANFLVDNTDGGLQITSTSRNGSVHVSDMSFAPMRDGAGTGLLVSVPEGGNQIERQFSCENVNFTPEVYGSAYAFNNPLKAAGMYRPYLRKCVLAPGATATTKQGTICDLEGTYKPEAYDSYFNGRADIGWKHHSTGAEGTFFAHNTINGPDLGLSHYAEAVEPELYIHHNHFNCAVRNALIDGAKYFWLTDNLAYCNDVTSFKDWVIVNANGGLIADNIYREPGGFEGAGSNARRHVDLTPRAGGAVREIEVREGVFSLQGATSVAPFYVGPGATKIRMQIPASATASGYDYATYPTDLVEVDSGASDVQITTPSEIRAFDAGAGAGPDRATFRDSASPAANDALGITYWYGRNSSAAKVPYASIRGSITDPTAGSEDGILQAYGQVGGTLTMSATLGNGGVSAGNFLPEPNGFLCTNGYYVRAFGANKKVVGARGAAVANATDAAPP